MGSSGYQINELEGGYSPTISEKGIDIYGGPRGSLAGTLPTWIAWWVANYRYTPGHIVYMPGVYNADGSNGTYYDTNGMSSRREEIAYSQDIQAVNLQEGGDLVGGDMGRAGSEYSTGSNKRQYFEYGAHTLWVKLFGEPDNSSTNDSSLLTDQDFFNVTKRRRNGWYCFYELMSEVDPQGSGQLEIAFPQGNSVNNNTWNNTKKRYSIVVGNKETLKVVYGSWGEDLFRQISCEPGSTTEIKVKHDETVLNMCDSFILFAAVVAANTGGDLDLINFVVCKSVLRSSGTIEQNLETSPVEVAILPSDKVSIGGNVLRSPQEVPVRDMVDPSFNGSSDFFQDENGQDETATMVSAGYPGVLNPESIFRAAQKSSDFDGTITRIAQGNTAASEVIMNDADLDDDHLYLDKLKFGKVPAYDPRFGEASSSLNSFISSVYNFSLPMSTSSSIDFWQSGQFYKVGKAVRFSPNQSEYSKSEANRTIKDVIWVSRKDHASTSSNKPPMGAGSGMPSDFENECWRSYGVLANQPNSSLLQLNDVYRDSEVFVGGLIINKSPDEILSISGEMVDRALLGSERRIRMSEMTGGSRLYASLTISPAKKFKVKYYRKRNSWGRRSSVTFRFPPAVEDAAAADLWLYANNFRRDHAGSINFAVTFVTHTSFVWAQAKKRRSSFFGILLGVALAVVGILNPALFLTAGMQCAAYGFGGGLALGALGGAVGLGVGTALGASAEAVYANLGKGVGRKKAFTRSSFSQVISKIANDAPSANYVLDRGSAPENGMVIGRNSSDVSSMYDTNLGGSNANVQSENDIIRFNFGNLYPYLYESKYGNTIHVSGQYQFLIQDLNSASAIKIAFNYEEISRRGGRGAVDSFGNTFSGYPAGTPEGSHAGANSTLWSQYRNAANEIVNGNASSTGNLKLISTKNYFNYLLIGPENIRDDLDPLKALVMWSMDLSDAQFSALVGMIQTGFRDLTFNSSGSFSDQDGLSDYKEIYTSNPPIAAAENVAATGYQLEISNNTITHVKEDKTNGRRVKILKSVGESQGMSREDMEVLAKGLAPGEFLLGKDLENSTPQYINFLKSSALSGAKEWTSINNGVKINGGDVIQNGQDFYFVNATFIKNNQNLSDVATLVPRSSSQIYTADSFSPSLTLVKQWQKMLESPYYTEQTNDRSASYYLAGRKLDFSFVVKESADPSLFNLFFFGFSDYIPNFASANMDTYEIDSVAQLPMIKDSKDLTGDYIGNGSTQFVRDDATYTTKHVFRLKDNIPRTAELPVGAIPGFKSELSWEYLGSPSDLTPSVISEWTLPVLKETVSEFTPGQDVIATNKLRPLGFWKSEAGTKLSGSSINGIIEQQEFSLTVNFPWIKMTSAPSDSTAQYVTTQNKDGSTVYLLSPYSKVSGQTSGINLAAFIPSNINDTWKGLMNNTILSSSQTNYILDAYLTNKLDILRTFEVQGFEVSHIQIVISPITDLIDKIEVWDPTANYSEGDVVLVHHTNYNYLSEETGKMQAAQSEFGKLWLYARATRTITNGEKPFHNDNPEPSAAPGSMGELGEVILPVDTKYWECCTAREGSTVDSITSGLGAKKLAKSCYGTDLDVKTYTVSMGEADTFTQPGRSQKTTEIYIPQQRGIYNKNVSMDFSSPKNLIFTTTISPEAKIVGRLPSSAVAYTNEGGTWPGTLNQKDTQYLEPSDYANLYEENPLINLFLRRSVNAGARWSNWIDGIMTSGQDAEIYKKITYSQGDEYQKFETMPTVELAVSKDSGSTFEEFVAKREFDENYPVFHKGFDIPVGIKATISNALGINDSPSNSVGSNLYGYISCLYNPGTEVVGGASGLINFIGEGTGSENVKLKNWSGTDIGNSTAADFYETIATDDESGLLQYGPQTISDELTLHSLNGINRTNYTPAFKIFLPETSSSRNPLDLCVQKCVLILGTRDSNDGLTHNRTKIKNFVSGSGIDFHFDNWFAIPAGQNSYVDQSGNTWPATDQIDKFGEEDNEFIKIKSNLNTLTEALYALSDVVGASTTHNNNFIDLSTTQTHYHGSANPFTNFDEVGVGYLTNILRGAGEFIGAKANASFNNSGTYIGGVGLTQTTVTSTEFMSISQPAFEDKGVHGKPEGSYNMYMYNDSNYTFQIDTAIPALLYKKYTNINDSNDVVNKNYYDLLLDDNCPGGGDSKADFTEDYVFNAEIKLLKNYLMVGEISHYDSNFQEADGYKGRVFLTRSELGDPVNNDTVTIKIDDGINCPHGANLKTLNLSYKLIDPPNLSSIANNINGKLYYYDNDTHVYSFGVSFPVASEFGGRLVIQDGIGPDLTFESQSGPPAINYTRPDSQATSVTFTIDDGVPHGFGVARTGAAYHNLIYPGGFNPVQSFPVVTIADVAIEGSLGVSGDGYIANKVVGVFPDMTIVQINKQYIYNNSDHEYKGLYISMPAFNIADTTDRGLFVSRSSISNRGISRTLELGYPVFGFGPMHAKAVLHEKMFPPDDSGTATLSIQDGTLLGSTKSEGTFEIPYQRLDKAFGTITGIRTSSTFKLWSSSPLINSGNIDLEGLVTCWEHAKVTIETSTSEAIEIQDDLIQESAGFTNFRWNFTDYDLSQSINSQADLIDGLYVTILDRSRGSTEGVDTWETFNYTVAEAIDLFFESGEYQYNYNTAKKDLPTDPLTRKRFSVQIKAKQGSPEKLVVDDQLLKDGGWTHSANISLGSIGDSAEAPIYTNLTQSFKYPEESNNVVVNRMGGQFNIADGDRRYTSVNSALMYSSYATLRSMIINYNPDSTGKIYYTKFINDSPNRVPYSGFRSKIKYDPSRPGMNEPNIWMDRSSFVKSGIDVDEYTTSASSNGAIDLCPNSITTFIWGSKAKWLTHEDENPETDSSPSEFDGDNFVVWNSESYYGSQDWEVIGRSNKGGSDKSYFHLPSWIPTFTANQDWFQTNRIPGWSLTTPHLSFINNYENFQSYGASGATNFCNIIKNGTAVWGGLSLSDAWIKREDVSGSENWFGYDREGYIGLQTGQASRMNKFIHGLAPGVTYRLYISAAWRPNYGPSGVRVYVCEPDQSQSDAGDLTNELIGYGEFTCNTARSIDYNAQNHHGGRGVQTNFTLEEPYSANLRSGASNVPNGEREDYGSIKNHVGSDGFRLFYVEFTPSLGSGVIEVRLENAFVSGLYAGVGRSDLGNYDYTWFAPTQGDMFDVSQPWFESERKNWTEYSGVWASNGIAGSSGDQTVFIGDVFIKSIRPLYVETVKVKGDCKQGGFELVLKNGDTQNSTLERAYLRSPTSHADIFRKMSATNYAGDSVDLFSTEEGTLGWFEVDEDYEIDIIRQNPYLLTWDPFAVDAENYSARGSNQGYIAQKFVPDVFGNAEHGAYDLDMVVNDEAVEALYEIMLGRAADEAGKTAKINNQMTVNEVIEEMLASSEYADYKAIRNLPDDPRPGMSKERAFYSNLMSGFYLGHTCFYHGNIWQLKQEYRTYGNDGTKPLRPGYENYLGNAQWNWTTEFDDIAPSSTKWENISNKTSSQIISDAASGTGAYHNSSLSEIKVWNNDVFVENLVAGLRRISSVGMMWSAHYLDSFFRRPFIQENLETQEFDYLEDLGAINNKENTLLLGESRTLSDASFRFGDSLSISNSNNYWTEPSKPTNGTTNWKAVYPRIMSSIEREIAPPQMGWYGASTQAISGANAGDAEFALWAGGFGGIDGRKLAWSVGPEYPVAKVYEYQGASNPSGWSTLHDNQEILLDPLASNFDPVSPALNNSQFKRMIGNSKFSKAYAFGVGNSVELSSRGASRDSRIELPIYADTSSEFIGDNYYGGSNPIPHRGLAGRVLNAGFLNDYATYNSSTDQYKYSSASLSKAFEGRIRINFI
jgi:hypothetical protein